MRRIAVITGGRDHTPQPWELRELHRVLEDEQIDVVRCGGCTGVDKAVYDHVRDVFAREEWPADWDRWGKNRAGPLRNKAMLTGDPELTTATHSTTHQRAHVCIAFEGGDGTADCVRTAEAMGIEVRRIGR